MAEGLLKHLGGDAFSVKSAESSPSGLNPHAVKVMSEIGIDISQQESNDLLEFINEEFNYIITVCDNVRKACPVFPGSYTKIHWSIKDPGNTLDRMIKEAYDKKAGK